MKRNKADNAEFWKKAHNEVLENNFHLGKRVTLLESQIRMIRRDDLMNIVIQLPEGQQQEVKDFAEYLLEKYNHEAN